MLKTLSYGRQWINDDDIAEVVKVLKGDWLTNGPAVSAFEGALAEYTGAKHAVVFANGTAALHGAMTAAGLSHGQRALTTPLTFAATANSAIYAGGEPVFADISPRTLCLDPNAAEEKMKETPRRIKVIAPVSFAGYPFDIRPFREMADRSGAVLIEDACHSLGGKRGGRMIGLDADMTALSFHPVKHITSAEGGAVLTENDEYAKILRTFRAHGIVHDPKDFIDENDGPWHSEMQSLGWNYRLSDVHCALGLAQMRRLPEFMERRRQIAAVYRERLSGIDGLELPPHDDGHAYHLFVVQTEPENRAALFAHLAENGIRPQVHYRPVPLNPYYRQRFGYKDGDFPNAERFYSRAMSLPMFPMMDDDDVARVCDCVRGFFKQTAVR